jgi:hypothetical protein
LRQIQQYVEGGDTVVTDKVIFPLRGVLMKLQVPICLMKKFENLSRMSVKKMQEGRGRTSAAQLRDRQILAAPKRTN